MAFDRDDVYEVRAADVRRPTVLNADVRGWPGLGGSTSYWDALCSLTTCTFKPSPFSGVNRLARERPLMIFASHERQAEPKVGGSARP